MSHPRKEQYGNLIFEYTANGLNIVPTPDAVGDCHEEMASRAEGHGRHLDIYDMLEHAIGNGWDYVQPEDVGALTEAEIISRDGFLGEDHNRSKWYVHPAVKKATVYAHMNYMVEDPIATWAEGKPVFLVKDSVTTNADYRREAIAAWEEATGDKWEVGPSPIRQAAVKLKCDMDKSCKAPVTMIDKKGYIYCTPHGMQRRMGQPCRKMKTAEIKKLEQGGAIEP